MRRFARCSLALSVALLLAGCTTAGHGRPAPVRRHALPASGVLLTIRDYRIYAPPNYQFRTVASLVITGDGTAIHAVNVPNYNGIPVFRATRIGADTLRDLLATADGLGLLAGPLDFGIPFATDPVGTTVTISGDGRTVTQTEQAGVIGAEPSLDAAQRDRRARLARFRAYADALVGSAEVPYRAPAIAVRRNGVSVKLAASTIRWPLPAAMLPPPDGCRVFIAAAALRLEVAAENSYVEAGWQVGAVQTSLFFRPVLPGSGTCS